MSVLLFLFVYIETVVVSSDTSEEKVLWSRSDRSRKRTGAGEESLLIDLSLDQHGSVTLPCSCGRPASDERGRGSNLQHGQRALVEEPCCRGVDHGRLPAPG